MAAPQKTHKLLELWQQINRTPLSWVFVEAEDKIIFPLVDKKNILLNMLSPPSYVWKMQRRLCGTFNVVWWADMVLLVLWVKKASKLIKCIIDDIRHVIEWVSASTKSIFTSQFKYLMQVNEPFKSIKVHFLH